MSRKPRRGSKSSAGFTLTEVMITMFLISMMCLSVFAGLQQITKTTISVALRNEGYHHMQQEAERLLVTEYDNFKATTDETLSGSVKTTFYPSGTAALATTSDNAAGRADFKRRVVLVSETDTSRTLRVEVEWTWQKRKETISTLLFRNR